MTTVFLLTFDFEEHKSHEQKRHFPFPLHYRSRFAGSTVHHFSGRERRSDAEPESETAQESNGAGYSEPGKQQLELKHIGHPFSQPVALPFSLWAAISQVSEGSRQAQPMSPAMENLLEKMRLMRVAQDGEMRALSLCDLQRIYFAFFAFKAPL